jgi:hypothetical protein
MRKSDKNKKPEKPCELAELRFKVETLQQDLDGIGYMNTLLCIVVRDLLTIGQVKKEHLKFLTDNDFYVNIEEI